jgi:L-ascorbate metabolism protein UlaG (beta-lactamase superfamily)
MSVEITGIGNEGFKIVAGDTVVYIDAFYTPALWVGSAPYITASEVKTADVLLVTHRHPDHFDEAGIMDVAERTGAKIVGPASVRIKLGNRLGKDQVLELEPALNKTGNSACESIDIQDVRITAFRTFHSPDHNSYLVKMPGFKFFHDGDNEDTSRVEAAALGRIDALFIAPWQGAHWVEFIEAVKPAHWFLMHLTNEELDQQRAGTFLPDLCDHVPLPEKLVTLGPGELFKIP